MNAERRAPYSLISLVLGCASVFAAFLAVFRFGILIEQRKSVVILLIGIGALAMLVGITLLLDHWAWRQGMRGPLPDWCLISLMIFTPYVILGLAWMATTLYFHLHIPQHDQKYVGLPLLIVSGVASSLVLRVRYGWRSTPALPAELRDVLGGILLALLIGILPAYAEDPIIQLWGGILVAVLGIGCALLLRRLPESERDSLWKCLLIGGVLFWPLAGAIFAVSAYAELIHLHAASAWLCICLLADLPGLLLVSRKRMPEERERNEIREM